MTNEDTAWEQFSKADAANIGDSSAVGMLQAIMAELNSVKADTARLAQKIDGGAEESPMDEGAIPPMDGATPPMEEPPAEVPPMEELPLPEAAPGMPASDMLPPGEGGMPDMGVGGSNDQTLAALQDALSQVGDPTAIAKLADIIKDYVADNYQALEAEAAPVPEAEIPPEAIVEALMEEAPVEEAPVEDVPPELMDALLKSEDAEPVQKACDGDAEQPESIAASEDAPAEVGTAEEIQASDDEEEPEPAIQINLFLGAKMEDIIDENAEKGLTDKDELDTESFKVCDPVKKSSIDDLMNQRMRTQSGVDGKRYKITKSASEVAEEEYQALKKSVSSFDAIKGMRVGDILGAMQKLGQNGVTSIEKSFAPVIDEMVKYCDNNISPIYTAPIFKSFGLDIGALYEPLDTEAFERTVMPKNAEKNRRAAVENANKGKMEREGISDPALQDRIQKLIDLAPQHFARENLMDKMEDVISNDDFEAEYANLTGADADAIKAAIEAAGYTAPDFSTTTPDQYLAEAAPYLFAKRMGATPDQLNDAKRAYNYLSQIEPQVRRGEMMPYDEAFDARLAYLMNNDVLRAVIDRLNQGSGVNIPKELRMSSDRNMYGDIGALKEHEAANKLVKFRQYLKHLADAGLPLAGAKSTPAEILEKLYAPKETDTTTFATPSDVFSGTFASYGRPAMKLGNGKLYGMGKTNAPLLEKYLKKKLGNNYAGSQVEQTFGNWTASLAGEKNYEERDKARKAMYDAIKAVNPALADDILNDNNGYRNGVLADSPLADVISYDKGNYQIDPDVEEDMNAWYSGQLNVPTYTSFDDDLAFIEEGTADARDELAGMGVDPGSKASKLIGGEGSYNTHNYGGAYQPKKTRVHGALKNMDNVLNLADVDLNDYAGMSDRDKSDAVIEKVTAERKKPTP